MAAQPTILSIGTATQDVFLMGGDVFEPNCKEEGKCDIHLPLGAKIGLQKVVFTTGGNATNAATTFARQGLHSEFMGVLGTEPAADMVLKDLDAEGVGTRHVHQSERYRTGYSTILLAPNGARTQLRYHGDTLRPDGSDIDLETIATADWLYISSVGSIGLLEHIVSIAAKAGVKVAFNPATRELEHAAKIRTLLDDITILIANKEEMALLVEGATTEELAQHATHLVPIAIVSDGPNGAVACDDKAMVAAGMYQDVKVVDRLGAGDAFGSGFTAMIAQGKSLEEAVVFASANSTSVVQHIGAKPGILRKGARLHDMPLTVKKLAAA